MDIDKLIQQAKELKSVSYDSPKVSLWEKRAKAFVKDNYGQEYLEILESSLSWGQVVTSGEGPRMHAAAMDRAIEFLDSLKKEPKLDKSKQITAPKPKRKKPPHKMSSFRDVTVSGGTVVFGDGNRITQVAVKELVDALVEEVKEKVPEGEKKKSVLKSLKEITTNETFANVAGTLIGEVLRRVSRP